jgi:hypothetical protein
MKYFSAILIVILLLFGCTKRKESAASQLPMLSQKGANTFGCIVNGKIFTTSSHYAGNSFVYRGVHYNEDINTKDITIWAMDKESKTNYFDFTFVFEKVNGKAPDAVLLGGGSDAHCTVGIVAGGAFFHTDNTHTIQLSITKHLQYEMISGTFSGKLIADSNGETLLVSDGRFDISY